MPMSMEQLQEQVEAACMGDAPYDETRSLLDARIASAPSNSGLLRLRIGLCEVEWGRP